MRLLRIALAPTNPTVGAVCTNVTSLIARALEASSAGADLVVFPELAVTGYPLEDLVQFPELISAAWVELLRFADQTSSHQSVHVLGLPVQFEGALYNCAALVRGGRVLGVVPKERLPSYGVFYEGRTFARGRSGLIGQAMGGTPFGDLLFDLDGVRVALEVCEDLWSPLGPTCRRAYQGAEIVVNVSASPYRVGIADTRRELVSTRSSDAQAVVVYCNLVGGNDGLVFDGGGYVAQSGRVLLDAARLTAQTRVVTIDVDRTRRHRSEHTSFRADRDEANARPNGTALVVKSDVPWVSQAPAHETYAPLARFGVRPDLYEELLDVLARGLADYFAKSGAFLCFGVALSGGRDSLLCLWLAKRASLLLLNAPKVHAFYMSSEHSSARTQEAARLAAEEFGASFAVVSIADSKQAAEAMTFAMLGHEVPAATKQNVQARVRGAAMWNWSNAAGALFLQTSNMSEKSVGYTTIGGDMEGAISPIANLPKTLVNALIAYIHEQKPSAAIAATLAIPASAELAPGQEDEKDLMPYPVLDAWLALLVGERLSGSDALPVLVHCFPECDAVQLKSDAERFTRLFFAAIYKWAQSPLGLHVGNLDLDRERALQLPVITRPEWTK